MSDILIKGMKMPDCCNTCPCCQRVMAWRYSGSYCGATGREIVDQGKINENCPLIEVPPHGRLIDADALRFSHCAECELMNKECFGNDPECWSDSIYHIDHAPTIIEAEEET